MSINASEARMHALEEVLAGYAADMTQMRGVMADMARHEGEFRSAVCMAAFGHADALTDEQIIESLRELRRTANNAVSGGAERRTLDGLVGGSGSEVDHV